MFKNNTALKEKALKLCGNDATCLYDVAETANLQLAARSKDIDQQYEVVQKDIGNNIVLIVDRYHHFSALIAI